MNQAIVEAGRWAAKGLSSVASTATRLVAVFTVMGVLGATAATSVPARIPAQRPAQL